MREIAVVVVLAWLTGCAAEERAPEPARGEERSASLEDALVPPELVLEHQAELGLDAAQLAGIREDLGAAQGELADLAPGLLSARDRLAAALAAANVDEQAALDAAREITEIEGAIKLARLRAMIRIEGRLTDDQRREVSTLRER